MTAPSERHHAQPHGEVFVWLLESMLADCSTSESGGDMLTVLSQIVFVIVKNRVSPQQSGGGKSLLFVGDIILWALTVILRLAAQGLMVLSL